MLQFLPTNTCGFTEHNVVEYCCMLSNLLALLIEHVVV